MAGKSYAEVQDINARSGKGKKQLSGIHVERSANGGFIAEHRFHSSMGSYHEPEQHTFGADEGKKLLSHLSEHLGIEAKPKAERDTDASEREEDEAEHSGAARKGTEEE